MQPLIPTDPISIDLYHLQGSVGIKKSGRIDLEKIEGIVETRTTAACASFILFQEVVLFDLNYNYSIDRCADPDW